MGSIVVVSRSGSILSERASNLARVKSGVEIFFGWDLICDYTHTHTRQHRGAMMVEWLAIDGVERNLQFATKQPQEVYMQWCLWLLATRGVC